MRYFVPERDWSGKPDPAAKAAGGRPYRGAGVSCIARRHAVKGGTVLLSMRLGNEYDIERIGQGDLGLLARDIGVR
jgi:hypothetical protein